MSGKKKAEQERKPPARRVDRWPLRSLIFSHPQLYKHALGEFSDLFKVQCEGHPPYQMIWIPTGGKSRCLTDVSIDIEDEAAPLETWERVPLWTAEPHLWGCVAAFFDDLVFDERVQLWGRWNSLGASLQLIPAEVFPARLEKAVADGSLDLNTGTLRLFNGESVYAIQFAPPAEFASQDVTGRGARNLCDALLDIMANDKPRALRENTALTNEHLIIRARNLGHSSTYWNEAKREALQKLKSQHPDLHPLYAKHSGRT